MNISKADYDDIFVPFDGTGTGHLSISGKNTVLKLSTACPSESTGADHSDQHGTLNDGSQVSLLGCVRTRVAHFGGAGDARHESTFLPLYILIGRSLVSSEDSKIQAIHYHFENVDRLVDGRQAFGVFHPEREALRKVLEVEHGQDEEIARDSRLSTREFDPEIGGAPILAYFKGIREILKCYVRTGSVELTNSTSYGLGSSKGVHIDNEVTVSLRFDTPRTVGEAISSLDTLHSFFELCLGRRQRYLWIEAELAEEEEDVDDPHPHLLELFWSHCNDWVAARNSQTSYHDVLLDAGMQKEQFSRVLSGWLDSSGQMGDARNRISNSFLANSYSVDRLVGAANAFDLLPDTHVPPTVEPDELTRGAVRECRKRFKELPESPVQQAILTALGQAGKPSLRDKICHRADILIKAGPALFPDLYIPCTQAARCRNHFVHGSEGTFDYWAEPRTFLFLADTLEFVFAASDLIELGWDYHNWRDRGLTLSHDFGSYVVNYDMNLQRLKQLTGTSSR